eukprot:4536033-Prymnesium_polylepis.2
MCALEDVCVQSRFVVSPAGHGHTRRGVNTRKRNNAIAKHIAATCVALSAQPQTTVVSASRTRYGLAAPRGPARGGGAGRVAACASGRAVGVSFYGDLHPPLPVRGCNS